MMLGAFHPSVNNKFVTLLSMLVNFFTSSQNYLKSVSRRLLRRADDISPISSSLLAMTGVLILFLGIVISLLIRI